MSSESNQMHHIAIYNNSGTEQATDTVVFGPDRIIRNARSNEEIAINEATLEIEERENKRYQAVWTVRRPFRLAGQLVENYGMFAIYFEERAQAEEMLQAIAERSGAESRLPLSSNERERLSRTGGTLNRHSSQNQTSRLSQTAIVPPIALEQPLEPPTPPPEPELTIVSRRNENAFIRNAVFEEPLRPKKQAGELYFLLTVRQLRLPSSIRPRKPLLITKLVRIYNERQIRLRPIKQEGSYTNYQQEGGFYNISILCSDLNEQDKFEFIVFGDQNSQLQSQICRREYQMKELLEAANLGKVYYLALEGVGAHEISYNNGRISEEVENQHYTKSYPFELEFSVILTPKRYLSTLEEFEVERQLKICEKQHSNGTHDQLLIPSRYGIDHSLGTLNYELLMKYRKVFMPERPPSIEVDFTTEHIIREFEVEESRSEMSSSIMSPFCLADTLRQAQRGFPRSLRVERYMELLNVEARYETLSAKQPNINGTNISILPEKSIDPADLQNFLDDYSDYSSRSPVLERMLRAYLVIRETLYDEKLLYCKEMIPIADRLLKLVQHEGSLRGYSREVVFCKVVKLFVIFVQEVAPYFSGSVSLLCSHLLHIRILVKEKMKEFNFLLNQLQIGLDNITAAPLLSLFSREHPELTYRIWDFLVYSQTLPSKHNSVLMPVLGYTYLTFLEANNLTAFIPINQFMLSLVHNLNSSRPCQHVLHHLQDDIAKSLNKYTSRDSKLAKLSKIKYVRRFIRCTQPTIHIPKEDTEIRSTQPTTQRSALPLAKQPNSSTYSFDSRPSMEFSTPVRTIHILLSKLSLGHSMNHQPFNVSVRIQSEPLIRVAEGCAHRVIFLNYYSRIAASRTSPLKATILIENDIVQLQGDIDLSRGYHKDVVYRQNVPLFVTALRSNGTIPDQKLKNDVAESIIECVFVLESERTAKVVAPAFCYSHVLAKKLLDYDFEEGQNALMRAQKELQQHFENMKHPLDEFGTPYEFLKIGAIMPSESSWIVNSRMSMEQIKTAFRLTFLSAEDKHLQMTWSTLFKEFSVKEECDCFEFGRFALSLVMRSKSSRREKLACLYQLVTAFQNLPSHNGISFESLQSLLEQMYIHCQYTNPQPYYTKQTSRVISAFLQFREKSPNTGQNNPASRMSKSLMPAVAPTKIERKDITSLVRTWQHMTLAVLRAADLMLGDNGEQIGLTLLKSLFDWETQCQLITHHGCRFEITYEEATPTRRRFSWIGEVDEKFKLLKRGERVLGKYPPINELNDSRSEAELMYNCENILPMTGKQLFNRDDFNRAVRSDSLLNYLVCCSIDATTRLNEPPVKSPKIDVRVLEDGKEVDAFPINQPQLSNSVSGIDKETKMIQLIKVSENSKFDKFTMEGTCLYNNDLTFGDILKLALQSDVSTLEIHYRTPPQSQRVDFYAVRRASNFNEVWTRCQLLSHSDPSFVTVRFPPDPQTGGPNASTAICDYIVPKYEIRGPGFLPAELFYSLIQ